MKAENLMDAIGNLHEGLLAESLPQKRRNFRPLVAVAAVAAALCVTVAAAYLVAPEFFYYRNGDETLFAARSEFGGAILSQERLDEYIKVVADARAAGSYWVDYTFDSLPEMVSDLGVNLLTNDRLIDHGCCYDVSSTHPTEVSEDTLLIWISYQPETAMSNQYPAFVHARISANTNASGTFYSDANSDIQTTTYYLERLDVTAAIATGVYGSGSTVAYFVKDGIAYDVETFNNSIDNMCGILDSFHY